jgi:hypothetical protein
VIDVDRRDISSSQPITQDWVQDAERRLPDNIRHRCIANNCFAPHGVIKKAAAHFQVTLPTYPFTTCETTESCASDSICAVQGYQSQKPNICVKKCETNNECGNAYTCRYQCVHGENGCPESAEKICIPDLLSPDVLKDPHSFVGFEDGEIHRRRVIAQQYPEFSEDYEKGSCFTRCSVKVIERNKSYFYAFVLHGSSIPRVKATCVRVDGQEMTQFTVSKVGEFDSSNIDGSYTDIDPMTCTVK